mgnify:CR=1 FL=1
MALNGKYIMNWLLACGALAWVSGDEGLVGWGEAARLEITAIAHNQVPGQATMRLHTHIYIGRTAVALDTGERHRVDFEARTGVSSGAFQEPEASTMH